ncbi:hypothetical protein [uncultured Roseobacter sp.]|uniref:hypothetical protein n=1 Tax=uncultured Roseobacter sp. TaxID=114847 RepID=UPI002606FECC|nr:hypothetical protein [uncultured Roseobacter sp.]
MKNDDNTEFAAETAPGAGAMDYVISPPKAHGAAGDDDDVVIPDTILWDLAGGNVTEATREDRGMVGTMVRTDPDPEPAVVYDMAPIKTVVIRPDEHDVLRSDPGADSEGNGLCDIMVRDDDDDSGQVDGFEWAFAGGTAFPEPDRPIENFDHEELIDIVEPDMPSEPRRPVEDFDYEDLVDIVEPDMPSEPRRPVEDFDYEELIDIVEPDMPSEPRRPVEDFDHEELIDIVEPDMPSEPRRPVENFDHEELIDIVEPDMPSEPRRPVEDFDHEELGDIVETGGTDTIPDFTDDTLIEVEPMPEMWLDLG